MTRSVIQSLVLVSLAVCSFAIAQSAPRFSLRDESSTVMAIPSLVARSTKIPFNKRYDELTPEQRAYLNSMYERMGPQDEPPFPLAGIGPIVRAIAAAQSNLLASGPLYLIVDVASDGTAREIKAIGSPGPEMTKIAAGILLLTKYKPAVCDGQACRMQYVFAIELK